MVGLELERRVKKNKWVGVCIFSVTGLGKSCGFHEASAELDDQGLFGNSIDNYLSLPISLANKLVSVFNCWARSVSLVNFPHQAQRFYCMHI